MVRDMAASSFRDLLSPNVFVRGAMFCNVSSAACRQALLLGTSALVSLGAGGALAACPEAPAGTYTCTGSNGSTTITRVGPITVLLGDAGTNQNATFSLLAIENADAITVTAAPTSAPSSFTGSTGIFVNQSATTGDIRITGINTPMNVTNSGITVYANTTGTTTIETIKGGTITSSRGAISYVAQNPNSGAATITIGDAIFAPSFERVAVSMYLAADSTATNTINVNADVTGSIVVDSPSLAGKGTAVVNIASGVTISTNQGTTLIGVGSVSQGVINNSGTIRAEGNQTAIALFSNTVVNNKSGATISADSAGLAFKATGSEYYSVTINNEVGATIVGAVTASTAAAITINNAGSWTLNGNGEIYGQLNVNNSGTVNVESGGVLSANGGYTQSAGSTTVNGTLNATVTLNGGTLGGSGTVVGNVNAGAGAIVAPGNSVGTLTVTGNASFVSGSTYRVEIQGASADLLTVGGTATLAGTMQLVAGGGSYTFYTPYTVLTTAGGVSGTFGTITTEGSFGQGVTSEVSYTSDSVRVTLRPGSLAGAGITSAAPGGLMLSSNAAAVAAGIDRAVANGADPSFLYPVYSTRDIAALNEALKSLSGEVHSAARGLGPSAAVGFLQAALDPFAAGRVAGSMPNIGAGPTSGAYASGGAAGLPSGKEPSVAARFVPDRRYAVWGQVFGSTGRSQGDAHLGTSASDSSSGHVALGVDLHVSPDTVLGAGIAVGEALTSLAGRLGDAKADIAQAGLYGMTRIGALSLGAALGYASADTDTTRAIPLLGSFAIKGKYRADIWSGRVEAAYRLIEVGGLVGSPYAAFTAQHIRTPGFIEYDGATGLPTGLAVDGRSNAIARAELGLRLDATTTLFGMSATAFGKLGWAYYARRDNQFNATLVGLPGSGFVFQGARGDRNAALVSTGLDLRITPAMTLGARFDGEFSTNAQTYAGAATLKVNF